MLAPTSSRDRVTHGTHLPEPTLQQENIIQLQLKSCKAAGLEQGRGSAIFLPSGAKWCQNGAHAMPPPHILSHSLANNKSFIHEVVGTGNGASIEANRPVSGVSNGGDDQKQRIFDLKA